MGALYVIGTELTSLQALQHVAIDSYLYVVENANLARLELSPALTHLDILNIQNNDSLSSVTGLATLTDVSDYFYIYGNPVLPTCQATALLNNLISTPLGSQVFGNDDAGVCL